MRPIHFILKLATQVVLQDQVSLGDLTVQSPFVDASYVAPKISEAPFVSFGGHKAMRDNAKRKRNETHETLLARGCPCALCRARWAGRHLWLWYARSLQARAQADLALHVGAKGDLRANLLGLPRSPL